MLNWTDGVEIANIYKQDSSDSSQRYFGENKPQNKKSDLQPEQITKIKIKPSMTHNNFDQCFVSNKDNNLIIEDNTFELPDGYTMRISPTHDKDQNMRMVIIAPSGSGKSTFAKNFILDYKKKYPNKDVFLFSRHDKDPSIDEAKPIRINLSEQEIIESIKKKEPVFTNKNLAKSLVIFDDTFTAESKILTSFWDGLATDLYQNGRKLGIDLIFIMHNTNYSKTRYLMSEASHYVFFLRAGSRAMYTRLLDGYLGFKDKKIQKKLFDLPTRYIIFSNTSPQFIMTENQVFDQSLLFND